MEDPTRNSPHDPAALLARRVAGARSSAVRDLLHDARRPGMLSLAGGLPAPDLFDIEGLRDAMAGVMADGPCEALQYGTTEGEPALRALLAQGLRERGLAGLADDAPLITTGSQQALDLVARALLEPGDGVIVERPAYLAALQVFALAQARCIGVPGDANGIDVAALPRAVEGRAPARFAYVVSNFANPTGATLSLARRLAILEWAVANRVFVLEDDPYGALRVDGEQLPPLVALAARVPGAADWCGYVSSLSKVLAPGLRIGYAVLPAWLRAAVVRTKQALDLHTSTLNQAVAARYLATGRLAQRMPAMLDAYRARRDALCAALAQTFGGALQCSVPEGGMFVWARFTDGTDTARLLPLARDAGMIFVPGEAFYDDDPDRSSLRLSFSTATPAQLGEAVARLAAAHRRLRECRAEPAIGQVLARKDTSRELESGSIKDRVRMVAVRNACVAVALQAWEDAGIQGLCAEGRWEAAIGAIRSLDPAEFDSAVFDPAESDPVAPDSEERDRRT
jgi:DNA-binding transcriptional MocR family regulator